MSARRARGTPATAYYTTHQVAGYLGVSLATVVNWVKQGRMDAHRTPGGHRRISRDELVRFCRDHDYPLPAELLAYARTTAVGPPRVLILHGDRAFAELVRDYLALDGELDARMTDRPLEAGFLLAAFRPLLVLLDPELPDASARQVARLVADLDPTPLLVGCVTLSNPTTAALVSDGTLSAVVERSTSVAELARRLRAMLPA